MVGVKYHEPGIQTFIATVEVPNIGPEVYAGVYMPPGTPEREVQRAQNVMAWIALPQMDPTMPPIPREGWFARPIAAIASREAPELLSGLGTLHEVGSISRKDVAAIIGAGLRDEITIAEESKRGVGSAPGHIAELSVRASVAA